MEKEIIKTEKYTLNKEEGHIVHHCLEYCWHRLTKHKKAGISYIVNKKAIEKLLKDFGGEEKNNPLK